MNILVTGANGLVGHDITQELQKNEDYYVCGICHSTSPKDIRNIFVCDLTKKLYLDFKPEVIIHCAACIPSREKTDIESANVNRIIDDKVIEFAKINNSKIIFFSSTSMYGNFVDGNIQNENTILHIESKYLMEKRVSEQKILELDNSNCIFRIPAPYSCYQKTYNVLKIFIEKAYYEQQITCFGTGERTQNYIHTKDIASAVDKCIKCNANGVMNLAYDRAYSMNDCAKIIQNIIKEKTNMECEIYHQGKDLQEEYRSNIENYLVKEKLNWLPKVTFEEGIGKWIEQLISNQMNL